MDLVEQIIVVFVVVFLQKVLLVAVDQTLLGVILLVFLGGPIYHEVHEHKGAQTDVHGDPDVPRNEGVLLLVGKIVVLQEGVDHVGVN